MAALEYKTTKDDLVNGILAVKVGVPGVGETTAPMIAVIMGAAKRGGKQNA